MFHRNAELYPVQMLRAAAVGSFAILLLLCCASVPQSALAGTATKARQPAPDFTLADANGHAVSLSKYKGQIVLLDFWATWCGGCKVEIPWYMEFENKYKSKGLAVLGVSMDEDGWTSVKPFLEKKQINYPIVIGDEPLAKLYKVDAMPMTLLIDRDGKIAASHIGLVDKDAFEKEIQALLQEKAKAGSH